MTRPLRLLGLTMCVALASVSLMAQRQSRWSDQQLSDLANRVVADVASFRLSLQRSLDRGSWSGAITPTQVNQSMNALIQAADRWRDRVETRQATTSDAQLLLQRGATMNSFITQSQFELATERDWETVRSDLDDVASAYGLRTSWSSQPTYTPNVDIQQVSRVLARIEQNTATLQRNVDQLSGGFYGRSADRDNISFLVSEFSDMVSHFRDHVARRIALTTDVEDVLNSAFKVDSYMRQNRLTVGVQNTWNTIRRDLDSLAASYDVAWDWNNPNYTPVEPPVPIYHRWTGTYELDATRSDNPRTIADRAARSASASNRQQVTTSLLNRLDPPQTIAIDRNENNVTIASSRGAQMTFQADGRLRSERNVNGRTITTRATIYGDQLMVSTVGDRGNDFTVTFEPVDNGRELRVTRRITSDELSSPVTAMSLYRRTSDTPDWNIYESRRNVPSYPSEVRTGYGIPGGTRLTTTLDTPLDTTTAREGDRFTVTITSPYEYDRSIIEGVVSRSRSNVLNRSDLVLNFDRVRMRDGRSTPFSGILDSVRLPDGTSVKVDNEGMVQGQQSDAAIQRGAVGAAVGAIIGAIAGGAKGAAIGAVIGGAGGAGTVFIEGRSSLQLPAGTELTIVATGGGLSAPQRR